MKYICKKYLDNSLYFYFGEDLKKCTGHNFWQNDSLLFLNIPKCASTSISNYLKNIENQLDTSKKQFKFVFLRNPMDRLMSAFTMKHANLTGHWSNKKIIEKYMGFLLGNKIPHESYNDMMHFIPQHVFIDALNIKFDFIGTVENIENDIKKINNILNVNGVIKYENLSPRDNNFIISLKQEIQKNLPYIQDYLNKDITLYNSLNTLQLKKD